MKKILFISKIIFLVFYFQTLIKADNISDFEIERMSIGSSLLDYLSKYEIELFMNNSDTFIYENKKFAIMTTHADKKPYKEKTDEYDFVSVIIKPFDSRYKIYGLIGSLNFDNDIKSCRTKKKIIVNSISSLFKNAEVLNENTPHYYDKTGNSKTYSTWFNMNDGDASVVCMDWSKKFEEERNWGDSLKVSISSKEFTIFRDAKNR